MKLNLKKIIHTFLIIFSYLISVQVAYAQIYGLEFQGDNFVLDRRTELDLTPDKFFKFKGEFEISFDFKAIRTNPNSNAGLFGYIFRVIDNDDNNIDLVSRPPNPQFGLNLVLGKSHKIVPLEYSDEIINKWTNIRVKFLPKEGKLVIYAPDTFYVQENIGFEKSESFKIIFGANDYKQFKSSDVPSMFIKDIKISENDKIKYHWPLNEKDGTIATDKLKGVKAKVINPSWLVLKHQSWQRVFEDEKKGVVKVASDNENGEIFMVGNEQLTIYSTQNNKISRSSYKNEPLFLDPSYRIFFNTKDKKIYSYIADELPFYSLDVNSGKWNDPGIPINFQTKFRHHNSFYRPKDNSIYTFGGYGGHKYSNKILKISIDDGSRTELPSNKTVYQPRYLSGLGELNDTIYILGGYGSVSGNQIINPHSYFNLIGYSLQNGQLFEKFKIEKLLDDMVVGNNIWIDNQTRNYYALIFNKVKFENHLQLIKGNLDSPEVELVGDKIPFQFIDKRSFIALYYMPGKNKLYTYVSYASDSTTQLSVYSINYPPNKFDINTTGAGIIKNVGLSPQNKTIQIIFIVLAIVLIIGVIAFFLFRRNKISNKLENVSNQDPLKNNLHHGIESQENIINPENNNLIFFGGFQVFDREFNDVTSKFPPMLKELFLLILLNSYKNNKGISSEKIIEKLWRDKSERSARNNMGVNIAKLRGILQEIGECELSKKTGYWKISFSDAEVRSDYLDFLKITTLKENLKKQHIDYLIEITQKGAFLINLEYPWLDDFKAMVSDRIVDAFVEFGKSIDVKDDADFIIHLADSVFNFDPVNEEAMILKCKAQYLKMKHSLAKTTYEKFCKEYKEMYGEDYDTSFHDITMS